MIKKIFFLTLVIWFANCTILNPIGLTYERERGSEVAGRITDAAIQADLVNSLVSTGGRFAGVSIFSIVAADIAKIESDKYYIKDDVDQCINDIRGFKGFVLGSLVTNIISCNELKTDGYILGDPFPSF